MDEHEQRATSAQRCRRASTPVVAASRAAQPAAAAPAIATSASALSLRAVRRRAARSGGSATVSVWPSATPRSRIRLIEKSATSGASVAASGVERARGRTSRGTRAARPATATAFGVVGVDVAHAHVLGPQPERHAVPGAKPSSVGAGEIERADPRPGPARRPSPSRKFILPTKSATKAVAGAR